MLLALAVLIAALGIVNTLALSVIERTREIGPAARGRHGLAGVRRMVRLESVVIAIFGTLLGLVLGRRPRVGAGHRAQRRGHRRSSSCRYGQLVIYLVVGALIGVLAVVSRLGGPRGWTSSAPSPPSSPGSRGFPHGVRKG